MGNYIYECGECKTGYTYVKPVDETNKKCILIIADCEQYNGDGTCFKCHAGSDPLTIGSCPTKSVPLDDGTRADILMSVYDALSTPTPC